MIGLEGAVRAAFGGGATVVTCTPSAYATSHPISDVVVRTKDGRSVSLFLKDVATFLPGADAAKPPFLRDPQRERLVYEGLLTGTDVGSPQLVGAGDGWLLLEKVAAVELHQVGDLVVWQAVAEAAAAMHRAFAAERDLDDTARSLRLLRHDAVGVDAWIERARAALVGTSSERWSAALHARYGEVRDRLLALPQTIVHGELYASNVLVSGPVAPVQRVCPLDWEMAASGPGLLDLAALVAGSWSGQEREAIADAYLRTSPSLGMDDLDVCRLHLAVQWLGWSRGWSPPPEHAHGWLAEARALSERLGLT